MGIFQLKLLMVKVVFPKAYYSAAIPEYYFGPVLVLQPSSLFTLVSD